MIEYLGRIMINGLMAATAIVFITGFLVLCYYNPIFPLILVIMGGLGVLMNHLGWNMV